MTWQQGSIPVHLCLALEIQASSIVGSSPIAFEHWTSHVSMFKSGNDMIWAEFLCFISKSDSSYIPTYYRVATEHHNILIWIDNWRLLIDIYQLRCSRIGPRLRQPQNHMQLRVVVGPSHPQNFWWFALMKLSREHVKVHLWCAASTDY